MATEFKIGRLRYTWRGYWDTAVEYNRDAVVHYNGKTYVCLEPHTSTNFYNDLTYIRPSDGASLPRWLLMVDGRAWKTEWAPSTYYFFGNIVTYGGVVYICTDEHTSGLTQLDLSKWTTYSQFDNWSSNWSPSTVYGLGDIVRYGGIVYRCITDHISAATTALGLEADQDLPSQTNTKWEIVNAGIEYKGSWQSSLRYKVNDLSKNGTDIYKCIEGHTSTVLFDEEKWELWMPGQEYNGQWSNSAIYQPGDITVYGGYSYICKTINNQNNIPTVSSTDWDLLTQGYRSRQEWQSGTSYRIGDVVYRGGYLYVALLDNVSQDPSSNNGNDTTYWSTVVPGIKWKDFWQFGVSYVVGEVITWQNITYTCKTSHVSSTINRPDSEAGLTVWDVYAIHAKENAGNTIGDLVSYKDGHVQSIHIIPENGEEGDTETYVLKISSTQPNWAKIFEVPDVFYVAPTGVDSLSYGKTWDQPWKSVKYACDTISSGFFYQNANDLVVNNKEFLVEEMYQWMLYQKANNISPFTSSSLFDEESTKRDARYVVDALSHDIVRGSNGRTVVTARAYFKENSKTTFFNNATADVQPYIVASLNRIKTVIGSILTNNDPATNYQNENILWNSEETYQTDDIVYYDNGYFISLIDNNTDTLDVIESWEFMYDIPNFIVSQYKNNAIESEAGSYDELSSLLDIIINAVEFASAENLPRINEGLKATVYIKTGTYSEELPIVIPDNTALVGDELRGTVVQPITRVHTFTKSCSSLTDRFTLQSVNNLEIGMPIQFSASSINDDFGGINLSTTYYVAEIVSSTVGISLVPGGDLVSLISGVGNMTVFAGDCLKDMFYMRNGTGLRNMTLTGLAGSIGSPNEFTTRRPSGGAYTSLDPGLGPTDTKTWIISRSPYCQNVTTFGIGCVGMKIDGTLHNGGNRSMVANDYTQVLSDGIGVWCTGTQSLTECVSVFTYYNYVGYLAEDGGRIRATNGNSSYGTYGVLAEGYDDTESPITGLIDNRSDQVQASVQSAFGSQAEILSLEYENAGSNYYENTTNIINYSNLFTSWLTDGNVSIQKNIIAPFGESDGWTLTGNTSSTDSSYIYQNIAIQPPGDLYTNVPTLNISGNGINATFDITVGSNNYFAIVNAGGDQYVTGNELRIPGSTFGGADGENDCFLEVTSLAGASVLGVNVSGTVPTNSDQSYTISLYVKQGTATTIDISAIFSGSTTATTTLTYNFSTDTLSASVDANGALPKSYNKLKLTDGWYRIWMTVYDNIALNNNLQVRVYPRGKGGLSGSSRVYGLQVQLTETPTFYLETTTNKFTSHANYTVIGSGVGAELLGDEIRSNAIFETRLTDNGTIVGGRGYLVSSNNAQGGDNSSLILSGSDTNTETNYIGMRAFIESGTGAGQYGYISAFDDTVSKIADILKESFIPLKTISTDSPTGILTLSNGYTTESLYLNQKIQFIPTYYNTTVTQTGIDSITVSTVIGGSTNVIVVSDTSQLTINMPIRFSGAVFGGVTTDFTYYIKEIIDSTTFTISTEIFGSVWLLSGGTGTMTMTFPGYNNYITASTANMQINMPINFTGIALGGITVGSTYYINEVISPNTFTISSTLVSISVTGTSAGTNYLTTTSTTQLVPLNPIKFTGSVFGNVVADTVYYINKIVNNFTFTIVESLIETTATATQTITNLITVTSTTGFIANNPIQFIGKTTGGIVNGTTYYILAINDETTFTISTSPGGSAINLSTSVCDVLVRTTPSTANLSTDTGTMSGTSTNTKTVLTSAYGSMNGTYSTSLFGDVVKGTSYYVKTIDSNTTFTISDTLGGTPFTLKTDTGSMNVAAVGWDHIHPGTPIEVALDNSSVYYVEPRITFESPTFGQTTKTINTAAPGTEWSSVAYGNGKFITMPNGNAIAGISSNGGNTWTASSLPASLTWTGIAFGNNRWVTISSGGISSSISMYSINDGEGWKTSTMPVVSTWSHLSYGNGKFVAVASGTNNSAYTTDYGKTWLSGSGLATATWTSLTYGKGKFVAVASGTDAISYSTDGISWTSSTLPSSSTWSSVSYGNGVFVAVSSSDNVSPAYSNDGITWESSPYTLLATTKIVYGNGIFVAGHETSGNAYTSEDGFAWVKRSIDTASFNDVAFGWDPITNDGIFVSVGGTTSGSVIKAGSTAKARVNVSSSTINSITIIEPGSNYAASPSATITDPNVTINASVSVRVGDGVLSNPTFINKGQDYNTNSTIVKINGGGYADTYQQGLTLIVKELSALPSPGDNLVITGNSTVYKVTNATAVYGTTAPHIQANIQISPEMTVAKSPEHETALTIRTKYSQCRLTGHDFLNVGYGNYEQSNYPNLPTDTVLSPQDQAVEVNFGRVFYTSTDQDGNFKVGDLFGVEQATGIVTLSATQFGLTGLETLSLGGIAVGSQSVVIRQFSTDSTFIANSNNVVPTQKAIKAYLTSRLSQGGSNTFTGQLIAGTVVVGGADKIRSTIPEGTAGSVVNIPVMTRIQGEFAGWDGDGMALSYFMKTWKHR